MDFAVILGFIAMVLAPCVVALWGRMRDGEDEAALLVPEESLEPHFAAGGLFSRSIRRMKSALSNTSLKEDVAPAVDPAETLPAGELQIGQPVSAASLEELLQQAVESARLARAAYLRADAAASEAAARIAVVRAEAAAEEAARARLEACMADDMARAAQQAYDTARTNAEEAQTLHIVSQRRAA